MIRILFVCMGNICRSPMAEGVFQKLLEREELADQVMIDSAGTHAYHLGKAPDERAIRAARERGIDISHLRARQVEPGDFEEFDLVLVMDEQNYDTLLFTSARKYQHKLGYLLDYAPHLKTRNLPDPYYGTEPGFDRVLDMIEDACEGLLAHLQERRQRQAP
ncbi:protein-tyrosine phosphatase [Methylomarinovum caldicuralii]|uniref:protein-tyrosine-phosphatase n=1 Tax=Methylomarinovum caldicuralii TaxID=438856 RepID=A0AAU9CMK2_9GAMM|nr:low molecular weight protein-tyrosine-phosphatase [Methylomarinovum caldicuralii]BCX81113.1 protein-tyrosine phosphatase [Methylomarinovum caldicuralii]